MDIKDVSQSERFSYIQFTSTVLVQNINWNHYFHPIAYISYFTNNSKSKMFSVFNRYVLIKLWNVGPQHGTLPPDLPVLIWVVPLMGVHPVSSKRHPPTPWMCDVPVAVNVHKVIHRLAVHVELDEVWCRKI